jgi:fumarate reductase flavoprotein subunit
MIVKKKKLFSILSAVLISTSLLTACGSKSQTDVADKDTAKVAETYTSDVLVIGGGGTGLVAALSASEKGSNVIILEKQATFGGATSMSSGKIPAADTEEQKAAGITDSVESMMRDINRAGGYTQNQDLLKVASENATPIKEWLEGQGVKWTLETNMIYYGQSTYRIHVAEGAGVGIVKALTEKVESNENIIALKNMTVTDLIEENGSVVGAKVVKDGKTYEFKAGSVVLATSGFGANKEMIAKYTPAIINAVPNVAPGATGEGITWGQDLGAETRAMNAYQAYAPITFDTHKSLGSAFLDNGGILVNKDGKRFINEYVGYSPLGTAIANQKEASAWMVWNQTIQDKKFPTLANITASELISATSPEELAKKMGINETNFINEINLYQEGIQKGEDYLNRTKLPTEFNGTYYATKITADYRHTQGGLVISPTTAAVLKEDGKVIPHLFAGGGVTEGFSSNGDANYMAGNGLLQAFVFGRIAGQSAADDVKAPVKADTFSTQKSSLVSISKSIGNQKVSDTKYKNGTYEGKSEGRNGEISVTVIVKDSKISEVAINSSKESEGISDAAIEELPSHIVAINSPDVEIISGATVTSEGIIEAVKDALKTAK